MKKRTKSRSSSSLSQYRSVSSAFLIAVLVCLAGASSSFMLFTRSFFETLSKHEAPIATISFKYKTAQRKFIDVAVWDRLKQKSDLYNGDTIHTSNLSQATITFIDGNEMVLADNTMAQIFLLPESFSASVLSGSAYVETAESAGFVLESSGKKVALETNSAVNIEKGAGGDMMQVYSGGASISDESGTFMSVGEGSVVSVGGSAPDASAPRLSVENPRPNQNYLYHSEGATIIPFKAKFSNVEAMTKFVLEISCDKNFSTVVERKEFLALEIDSLSVSLGGGIYYWRISPADEGSSYSSVTVSGKIRVIQSIPPVLLAPADGYTFNYRKRLPAVRMIWSESAAASSYRLTVSKSADFSSPVVEMRSSTPSCIISTLSEGTYYWKAEPFYSVNKIGFSSSSETGVFRIEQKGALPAPSLYIPTDGSIIDSGTDAKSTLFSWRFENEAVKYKIEFFKGDSSVAERTEYATDNFISVNGSEFAQGKWSWRVCQVDNENNESAPSQKSAFYSMAGKPELKVIEPADNYSVSESLVRDMVFTWKKVVPNGVSTEMEIAADSGFSNIVKVVPADGYSAVGISLDTGAYFWRIRAHSPGGDFDLSTPPRQFSVIGNLDASTLIDPVGRAVARDTQPYSFKWDEVDGADYYKFSLRRIGDGKILYEDTVFDTSLDIDMYFGEHFIDKESYHWEVQAKANAVPGVVSRRSGKLAEANFQLVKLKPVEITSPRQNSVINGVDATLKKVQISWTAVDEVAESQIVVSRVEADRSRRVVYKNPTDKERAAGKLRTLKSILMENPDIKRGGNYEVIVYAKTVDGIDISNTDDKRIGRFRILPVEPLPAAENLGVHPNVFGLEYLKNRNNPRKIRLDWNAVENATDYVILVKDARGRLVLKTEVEGKNSYEINWLNLVRAHQGSFSMSELYNGTFSWSVEAVRRVDLDGDGENETVLQPGSVVDSSFVVEIPDVNPVSGKGARNPYGN